MVYLQKGLLNMEKAIGIWPEVYMEIKPGKSRTLYKYLLSYAITLLIPLVLFTYLVNTSFFTYAGKSDAGRSKGKSGKD